MDNSFAAVHPELVEEWSEKNSPLSLFVDSNQILRLAGIVLKIVFFSFPLMGVFYTMMTLLEVTEYELKVVGLILTRQVFLMISLVSLLPILFPHLSVSVFLAVPIVDFLAMWPLYFSLEA